MNILAFGIHPDDIELGSGATVILAVKQGHAVVLADLTDGSASSNGTPQIRAAEAAAAATIMGVRARVRVGLADGAVASEDPEQLKRVVACIRDARPDLVLTPSSNDPHPDHASGGVLIERALYLAAVHGYEKGAPAWRVPQALIYPGRNEITPHIIVDVTSTFPAKLEAIRAHASQFEAGKGRKPTPLNAADFMESVEARSRFYGRKIGVPHGEPFQTLYPVRVESFDIFGARSSRQREP
jgi:bacillithiol biosynthesis deacetylase BshB1